VAFKNSRLWVQHTPMIAARDSICIIFATFMARYYLHKWIEPYAPFHFFMVSCIFVAFRYGYKAALPCLTVSYFLGNYFFVKPYRTFGEIATSDLIQASSLFFVTMFAIGVIEKLQRTAYSQKLLIQVIQDRQRSLLYQQNELLHKLRTASTQNKRETTSS